MPPEELVEDPQVEPDRVLFARQGGRLRGGDDSTVIRALSRRPTDEDAEVGPVLGHDRASLRRHQSEEPLVRLAAQIRSFRDAGHVVTGQDPGAEGDGDA